MFHYENGLKLTSVDLAIDFRRRQPRGFISHAHCDHMARHELAFCTPTTARLYHHRMGAMRRTIEMPFGQSLELGPLRLTTLPAGHVLGSAMLLAEDDKQRLLYTGDFKIGASATAEQAEFTKADVLVMECTFGDPRYRLPPRRKVVDRLLELVRRSLELNRIPVVHAYTLGKSQEITRLLTDEGIPVMQHPLIHEISCIYEACGCPLGEFQLYDASAAEDHAVVVPPRGQRAALLQFPRRTTRLAVTGWAIDSQAAHRLGVDYALPLSDHADYDELWQCVERVQPRTVYCTHGPREFVEQLRQAGLNAFALDEASPSNQA